MKRCIYILWLATVLLVAPPPVHAQKQEGSEIIALAKRFIKLLAKEDFSSAVKNFDSTMKRAMPPERLQEVWKSLIAQGGPFKRHVDVRTEKWQQYDIVFVICEFEKSLFDVKVVFNSTKQIAGLFFIPSQPYAEYEPPAHAKPDSFREREVLVGTGEWAVPGTITVPVGNGPFPAVVLVHGSGPHGRDETLGPNKPFRDLAWGLASQGIAVLRYEKRTKEHAAKFVSVKESMTIKEETIEDALAAVSMLRNTEEIDAEKIFVLGHSLGGMLIPRIGMLDPNIGGFIVMAGSTKPLEDVILMQISYIFSLDGTISESEKAQLEEIKLQVARVKDPKLSAMTPSTDLPLGIPPKYWLDLRDYNPPEVAKNLKQPILILHGKRDYQVTMENFQGWKMSLSSRKNVKFKIYPKLNHLFIEGKGKSTPAEYQMAGHVAEIVINNIANWIKSSRHLHPTPDLRFIHTWRIRSKLLYSFINLRNDGQHYSFKDRKRWGKGDSLKICSES